MTEEEHEAFLAHYGILRKSGRYPWGSGGDPYQRSMHFRSIYDDLKSQGKTEKQIADAISKLAGGEKFTTDDLRAHISISGEQIRNENVARAIQLKNRPGRQMSNIAIGKQMGVNESVVRGWLKNSEELKSKSLRSIANALKDEHAGKPFLDVSVGNHLHLGVHYTKLRTALAMLRDEGYEVFHIKIPQAGNPGKFTGTHVLVAPGTKFGDAYKAVVKEGRLQTMTVKSTDGGLTFAKPKDLPISVDPKKISVRYMEEGGHHMDGVIELRRGVPELSLGANSYGQVRIAVNGTHYLKGMAMYADDLPVGVNIRFNTNKSSSDPKVQAEGKLGVMKPMNLINGKIDPRDPFGSTTYPHMYTDKQGNEKQSPLNIVGSSKETGNVEGRWDGWANSLSSQMLSKQPVSLAAAQLGKDQANRQKELDEITALTNPVVKQKLLQEFADSADSAAVHLKAAALPNQSNHVILPMNSMRPTEVYAPNFANGTKVVLIRHPHGGPFEIPELTVNNNNRTAKKLLGGALDAIGIHHSVAEQLSGADFDGDTVVVIPNDSGKVKSRSPLEGLKNFDAKTQYRIPEGDTTTARLTKKSKQPEMGKISNLITDMTIHGANDEELARAIRHSMVVIDADKHGLDYKRSALENGIADLKKKYQGSARSGASTIISRAGARDQVPERRLASMRKDGKPPIDPKTGELNWVPTGRTYISKAGKEEANITKGKAMEFVTDAKSLLDKVGGRKPTPMEEVYIKYANDMKTLGNMARKELVATPNLIQSKAAKAHYAPEVESLRTKLQIAQRNAPLERQAQSIASGLIKSRVDANPGLDDEELKKVRHQSLQEGRQITGADKQKVYITDGEWTAIQAGAVAHSTLAEIFRHAEPDRIRELATPRRRTYLTPGQIARARQLAAMGRPMSQIAEELGIPRTTILDNLQR